MSNTDEVIKSLEWLLGALELGRDVINATEANADADRVVLCLARVNEDGSGQGVCNFDARMFVRDIRVLIDEVKTRQNSMDPESCHEFSLKAALEKASQEVSESPQWLKTIYARNRAIAAAIDELATKRDKLEVQSKLLDSLEGKLR